MDRWKLPLEAFLAGNLAIWGFVLLLPFDIFNGPGGRSYQAMAEIAPEWAWGAAMFFLGAGQIYGALLDHLARHEHKWMHLGALVLSAWMYAFIAIMLWKVDPSLPGVYLWGWASVASLALLWNRAMSR